MARLDHMLSRHIKTHPTMTQLDMFPDLPRRLTHDEILAGFAELLRAVEAMEFWEPWP